MPACCDPEADEILPITTWISLARTDEENGCLRVIPGSHKFGGRHHENQYIPEEHLPPSDVRILTLDPGDVIFFSNLVCHSGVSHNPDRVRCSVDLRYQN